MYYWSHVEGLGWQVGCHLDQNRNNNMIRHSLLGARIQAEFVVMCHEMQSRKGLVH